MSEVWLGDIRLRNRLVTSSSLLGYGAPDPGLVPYGMSPISRFVPLERFGAVTTRTLTVQPRDGHANRYGGLSGRAIKPIGLRVVAELRDAGVTLPVIATGGIRTFDDCREYFWAGADAVSLGSASWLASHPGYALSPLKAWQIRSLLRRIELVSGKQCYSTQWHSRAAQSHG